MVERGRMGNISWNPVFFDFKQEAALQIMVSHMSSGCCCCLWLHDIRTQCDIRTHTFGTRIHNQKFIFICSNVAGYTLAHVCSLYVCFFYLFSVQSVSVNYKTAVRQDAEFILSCEAQGSPKMIFRWYKNGIYINTTKATRCVWDLLPHLISFLCSLQYFCKFIFCVAHLGHV